MFYWNHYIRGVSDRRQNELFLRSIIMNKYLVCDNSNTTLTLLYYKVKVSTNIKRVT